MNRLLLLISSALCYIAFANRCDAQALYWIPAINTSAPYHIVQNDTIWYTSKGWVSTYTLCSPTFGGSHIGGGFPGTNPGTASVRFSTPVNYLKIGITYVHTGEVIRLYINGQQYKIQPADTSAVNFYCYSAPMADLNNGDIVGPPGFAYTPWDLASALWVNLHPSTPIDSYRIENVTGAGNGAVALQYFGFDPSIFIPPSFADTVLCGGQTFNLPFYTQKKFAPGNVFTVQISDTAFTYPLWNIGSLAFDTSGTINCTLPSNFPAGTYRVNIISSSPVGMANGSLTVRSWRPDIPKASANTPVCLNGLLQLQADTIVGATYVWEGPGAFNSGVQHPVRGNVTNADAGYYLVRAVVNNCVSLPGEVDVTVLQVPTPKLLGNNSICPGAKIWLRQDSINGAVHHWVSPSGVLSFQQTLEQATSNFSDTGFYYGFATMNGCISDTDSIRVYFKPVPTPLLSSNSPVCETDSLVVFNNSHAGNVEYSWTGPEGYKSSGLIVAKPQAKITESGRYKLEMNQDGCVGADSIEVLVKPLPPKPVLSSDSPVKTKDNLHLYAEPFIPNASYYWSGPGKFEDHKKDVTRTIANWDDAGIYYCTVTADGCSSSSEIMVEVDNTCKFIVKPNPGTGKFTVEGCTNSKEAASFRFVNDLGQLLLKGTALPRKDGYLVIYIDMDWIAAGTYFMHISENNRRHVLPVVIIE